MYADDQGLPVGVVNRQLKMYAEHEQDPALSIYEIGR